MRYINLRFTHLVTYLLLLVRSSYTCDSLPKGLSTLATGNNLLPVWTGLNVSADEEAQGVLSLLVVDDNAAK